MTAGRSYSRGGVAIPRQTAWWDERRNTSRVFGVAPGALVAAHRALDHLRDTDSALVHWIEEGAPRLTDEEHRRRFGESWEDARKRKARR